MCVVVNLGYVLMGKVLYMYKKKMELNNVFRY